MDMKKPFEMIVAEHSVTVLRVCRAIVGWHDAEDAWSETFLSALRSYPDLPNDANVEAWLVTIAHRKAIDVIRKGRRTDSSLTLPLERMPKLSPSSSTNYELWDSVQSLPDKQRQAIAYHYLGGLPYLEIARILGGTADAARRAAADGVKNLRKTFNDVEEREYVDEDRKCY
jgi:RNA polymerase sigma factor (sigma-70 family)